MVGIEQPQHDACKLRILQRGANILLARYLLQKPISEALTASSPNRRLIRETDEFANLTPLFRLSRDSVEVAISVLQIGKGL